MRPAFVVLLLALPIANSVFADVVRVSGEFRYGPGVRETDACAAAESRAKEEALRQVYRESFSTLEEDSCRESGKQVDSAQCTYNRIAWSSIDGDIRSVKQLGRDIDRVSGASKCTVTLEVDVVNPEQGPDTNFYFEVKVDPLLAKPGDALTFSVEPSAAMYLAVFGWTPPVSGGGSGQVVRLFPNEFDRDPLIKTRLKLPSAQNSAQYDFRVEWAKGATQDFIDEYLIFVATKAPVTWLSEYGFDSFGQKLREIRPPDKRVVKRNYRIINQKALR